MIEGIKTSGMQRDSKIELKKWFPFFASALTLGANLAYSNMPAMAQNMLPTYQIRTDREKERAECPLAGRYDAGSVVITEAVPQNLVYCVPRNIASNLPIKNSPSDTSVSEALTILRFMNQNLATMTGDNKPLLTGVYYNSYLPIRCQFNGESNTGMVVIQNGNFNCLPLSNSSDVNNITFPNRLSPEKQLELLENYIKPNINNWFN